jgi:phosphonate transport system substrate-binding protein
MNSRTRRWAVVAIVLAVAAASAIVHEGLLDIRRGEAARAPAASPPHGAGDDRAVVRIGVVSRFAPNLIYAGYQPLIDYLNAHGRRRYELRPSRDYRDAVERLRRGEVAASFLGAWILRSLGPASGLEPLLGPLNPDGRSRFHDVLIVPRGSDIRGVVDLAGRRVALPSADSWAGNWLQTTALPAAGLDVADLDTIRHFDHHQTVVWRVLHGEFDAGVVKESVAARYGAEGLRVAARSEPIPGPPLVVRAGDRDPALAEIRALLLALRPDDATDAEVLAGWTLEFAGGFGPVHWGDFAATPPEARP